MDLSFRALLFWIGAAVAVVATFAILRATIGAGRGESSPRRRAVEVAYAVLPALALVALLAATWRRLDVPADQPAAPAPLAGAEAATAVR